jgi:hypothetical protein
MMKTLLSVLVFLFIGVELKGQVVLYSTDFGTNNTTPGVLTGGWVITGDNPGNFSINTLSISSGYNSPFTASGSGNLSEGVSIRNTGTSYVTLAGQINTINITSIQVSFGYRASSATYPGSITFQWSTDGTSWNDISIGILTFDGNWRTVNAGNWILLPPETQNASDLQFRFVFERNATTAPNFRIDDFFVRGIVPGGSQPSDHFRSKTSGDWNLSNSWESSSNNSTWTDATLVPTSSANSITIRSGHSITINNNASADQLTIENGGTLNQANNAVFTLNDGVDTDMTVFGTYVTNGAIPAGTGTYVVENGGVIRADANTGGNADNLAFSTNSRVLFKTGSVFQWNTNVIFETVGINYFPIDVTETEKPIFRISATNLNVGSNSTTTINGRLDVTGSVLWTGTGAKIFRDGITGTGNITQTEAGVFRITGLSAVVGLTNPVSLITLSSGGGLELAPGSQVELIANTRIDGAVFTNNGIFNCQSFIVSGSASFVNALGATLGIGSADGITTGAAGNIQTTGGRTFSTNATYVYNGTTNQVTGNALPVTVQVLSISSFGPSGNNTVTLTTNNTTASRLNLNKGYFVAGETGNLNIEIGGAIFGAGGFQPNDPISGTITFKGNGKTEGTLPGYPNLYAVIVSGGVDFNGTLMNAESAKILNRLQINTNGSVIDAPFYEIGSTLIYNTGGEYKRNVEWGSAGGQGYPHHVVVQGGTNLKLQTLETPIAASLSKLEIGGDLTIGNENSIGIVNMADSDFPMRIPLSVIGNLTIGSNSSVTQQSVLNLSSQFGGDFYLTGDFTRYPNGSYNDFDRAIFFTGPKNSTINTPNADLGAGVPTQNFSYLLMQKDAASYTLTLGCSVGITGKITFETGVVNTNSTNMLVIYDDATSSEANNASFVNGPVKKIGNDAFVFPVGKPQLAGPAGGGYRMAAISAPAQITDAFTAEFMQASATALGPVTAPGITRVSRCEYWKIDRTAGSSSVNLTLSWNERSNCNVLYVSSLPDLAIAHFNGTSWNTAGVNSYTGSVNVGTITWNNVSNFSPFSLASTDFLENILPLTLSSFSARSRKTDIAIDWMLTNNNDFNEFVIERSKDGVRFEKLKMVQAKVILNTAAYAEEDSRPFTGWNYYRLRAIDKTGKERISQTVKVWFGRQELIRISPNPASEKILINFADPSSISQIELVNITGQVLQRIQTITFNTEIDIAHLQAGMYVLRITGKNGLSTKSFMKQ